jgi:hypothetical protein
VTAADLDGRAVVVREYAFVEDVDGMPAGMRVVDEYRAVFQCWPGDRPVEDDE